VASLGVALPKIKRSSTKRRWWMVGEDLEIFRPLMFPAASSLNKSLDKTSAPKMNKKRERGSPCLRPLEGEKKSKRTAIDEDGERRGGDANSNPVNPRGVKP
jgi:hypothetical protein